MNSIAPDRPDPMEQPIRARVPESVSGGAFSTGVIVMTAQTEFLLDFVQNLGRPHQIVSRVVMPHNVLPQLIDALQRNIDIYRTRWGELPEPRTFNPTGQARAEPTTAESSPPPADVGVTQIDSLNLPPTSQTPAAPARQNPEQEAPQGQPSAEHDSSQAENQQHHNSPTADDSTATPPPESQHAPASHGNASNSARQASAQEVYDDLKIKDELLSGSYANAVMIGHGPHEFSFDFITNFYPNSAVSARVFLAAGQIPRLLDSLMGTWQQLRQRMPPPPFPGGSPDEPQPPTA